MRIDRRSSDIPTPTLGDVVVAACDSGRAIAADGASATELAARFVERVLLREHNTRLLVAMVHLAREIEPANDDRAVAARAAASAPARRAAR